MGYIPWICESSFVNHYESLNVILFIIFWKDFLWRFIADLLCQRCPQAARSISVQDRRTRGWSGKSAWSDSLWWLDLYDFVYMYILHIFPHDHTWFLWNWTGRGNVQIEEGWVWIGKMLSGFTCNVAECQHFHSFCVKCQVQNVRLQGTAAQHSQAWNKQLEVLEKEHPITEISGMTWVHGASIDLGIQRIQHVSM